MQQEKNNKILCYLFWALSIICMVIIFWLSSRTADKSQEQSDAVIGWLKAIFGDNGFTSFIVRKAAHCLEFTGLGLLLSCSLFFTKRKPLPIYAVAIASSYAITDEIHQLFVVGRSCQISDWCIDTAGAMLGAFGFMIIYSIINLVSKKSSKNIVDRGNI